MKRLVCCLALLPSLLMAQGIESVPVKTEEQSDSYFQAEEPAVPESISQRAKDAKGLFQQREIRENATVNNPFVITPHRPNYFLPIAYTSNPNDRAFLGDASNSESLQSVEFKFQLSVKFPVAYGIVGRNSSLWFAYTQQAYWQAYNSNISAPFRDTNHEPEAFIVVKPKEGWLGIKPSYITYGLNHQSNGQSGDLSRSWNRFYVDFLFETENTAFSIKPWYRFPESSEVDDNPDIEDYYGYGEFSVIHVIDDYSIDLMLRNNLKGSGNRGAVQVGFNFPLWGKTRGYIQYFNGYGQSLLDYNHQTQSLGIGVMLSNWL
ncbi:phospholipase A [Marinomonas posidonica]|uniref:Phospholipase A1 n=1 Tax=Marinomonas posidonica (strain CECT 7376 / NCIMB 14433 / IVIA-Po-181) TaxID=491952 RepID=F6CTE2_MARPP|nr:phospholipase A [Marinomonas posidonica]AEF53991.1 Phospholipase A(1) [Marinomonas posidonica IVIA-Po-181]